MFSKRPSQYPVVGEFKNGTTSEMHLYLEMVPEEIVLAPGQRIHLLAKPSRGLLPISVCLVEGGLQIHAHQEFDPDWHVIFNGKLVKAGHPTLFKEHE
jgi:hypothetical protein